MRKHRAFEPQAREKSSDMNKNDDGDFLDEERLVNTDW